MTASRPGAPPLNAAKNGTAPLLPLLALIAAILIWAAFLVVTRAAVTNRLGVVEVALLRFGAGAVLFAALLAWRGELRTVLWPRRWSWAMAGLPLLGGVAFMGFLGQGLRFASVADGGVFTPAMMPLYTALLSALLLGETFAPPRKLGFALIVAGALGVGGWEALSQTTPGAWRGHLLFTCASLSWAGYTVLFRASGMSPLQGGAHLSIWSAIAFALWGAVFGLDYSGQSAAVLGIQILFQGILAGFVATLTFFYAVQHLGASRTAAAVAFVPVIAALGAWATLGEVVSLAKGIGVLVVSLGVVLASGAWTGGKRL